jgi:hypothetical protein
MCHRCTEIRLAISKGQKLPESDIDSGASRQARAFVEVLKIELAALQAQPDHRA